MVSGVTSFIRPPLRAVKPTFSICLLLVGLELGRDGVGTSFYQYPQISTPGSVGVGIVCDLTILGDGDY